MRGYQPPRCLWTKVGDRWLDQVALSTMHRWDLDDCLAVLWLVEDRIRALEAEIRSPHMTPCAFVAE